MNTVELSQIFLMKVIDLRFVSGNLITLIEVRFLDQEISFFEFNITFLVIVWDVFILVPLIWKSFMGEISKDFSLIISWAFPNDSMTVNSYGVIFWWTIFYFPFESDVCFKGQNSCEVTSTIIPQSHQLGTVDFPRSSILLLPSVIQWSSTGISHPMMSSPCYHHKIRSYLWFQ